MTPDNTFSSESPSARKIACTKCGGAITLRGSKGVETVICSYCGSQLDLTSPENKILAELKGQRSKSLLPIGSKGTIYRKPYEVIGRIRYLQDRMYQWDEFLLCSKQGKYAWLVYENHHFAMVSTTKIKPLVNPKNLAYRNTFKLGSSKYTVFERLTAEVIDLEGELTWIAKAGDVMDGIDAIRPPYVYSIEWSKKEMEYFHGRYVPQQEVIKGFQITKRVHEPIGVYPCQPYNVSSQAKSINRVAIFFSLIFVGLLMWAWLAGNGKQVSMHEFNGISLADGFEMPVFTISKPNVLCKVKMFAGVNNAWSWINVDLIKLDEGDVYHFSKQISYYSGVEGGESWSEGSQKASRIFKILKPGEYTLSVSGEGGQGNSNQGSFTGYNGHITVYKDVLILRYYLLFFLFVFSVPVWMALKKSSFEHQRWGSEEDDDD